MGTQRTTYTVEHVTNIGTKLKELPPVQEQRPVGGREAIQLLNTEIDDLRLRGYSLAQIAEVLTQQGIAIKPQTLSAYLRRAKSETTTARKRSSGTGRRPNSSKKAVRRAKASLGQQPQNAD